ncbi:MAG: TetR/AcrR family transcriptional regulator, partial [Steroidobacteraceae bacterium]|nr:TetR/AcrR family transcriptional regulator [Steroidobacteraceae bacterium]
MILRDVDSISRQYSARRVLRLPKQDRSRVSLDRLLRTAEPLLARHGYAKFTLQSLSQRAQVSIGSIYHFYRNKRALVRDLQQRFLERIEAEHAAVIDELRRRHLPLRRLVPLAVRDYGEFLQRHAALLRVFMEIATTDSVVSANGKAYYRQSSDDFKRLLLDRRN